MKFIQDYKCAQITKKKKIKNGKKKKKRNIVLSRVPFDAPLIRLQKALTREKLVEENVKHSKWMIHKKNVQLTCSLEDNKLRIFFVRKDDDWEEFERPFDVR